MSIMINISGKENIPVVQELRTLSGDSVITAGCTQGQLQELLANEVEVNGALVFVRVESLDEEVPETFPNSRVTDEEGNVTVKTWREYANWWEKDGKALLQVGATDANGNRADVVMNDELRVWADHFGAENLITKSAGQQIIRDEFTDSIEL